MLGFTLSADDYVVKPFSPRELVERVKAILRRTRPPEPGDQLITNVQRLSARITEECCIGPVTEISGEGFLLGLRCAGGAKEVRGKLLAAGILTGSSNDPDVMRLLPPLTLQDEHVDALVAALKNL